METIKKIILGSMAPDQFFAMLFFAFIGVAATMLLDTKTRDKDSPRTPEKFHFGFWIKDNFIRILRNILFLCLGIRFYPELNGGEQITPFLAVGLGLGVDGLVAVVRKWKNGDFKKKT
jgi:Na+/melibiose symporter-like transporter